MPYIKRKKHNTKKHNTKKHNTKQQRVSVGAHVKNNTDVNNINTEEIDKIVEKLLADKNIALRYVCKNIYTEVLYQAIATLKNMVESTQFNVFGNTISLVWGEKYN